MATLTIADLDNGKRDLQTVSDVANSRAATATTRFGQQTTTLYESIRRMQEKGDAVIRNLGYFVPVDYAPGLNVTEPNFTVVGPDGKIYAAQAGALPFTTGAWNPDQWYPIQNDLNDRKLLVFGSLAEAQAAAATLPDGQEVEVQEDEGRYTVQAGALVVLPPDKWVYSRHSADIRDYGASTAKSDNAAACLAMSAALGRIVVPAGVFRVKTLNVDAPLFFLPGASLDVEAGSTCTIRDSISSPNQFIFRGAGDYVLTSEGSPDGAGENARQIHASWFGAYPSGEFAGDMALPINRAMTALGNTREGLIDFDIGNYWIDSTVSVGRCVWVRGCGTRRTVFRTRASGFDVFNTIAEGARFTDIQFEVSVDLPYRTSGAWIRNTFDSCEIDRVVAGRATENIILDGSMCLVKEIRGIFSPTSGAGSSLVSVRGGTGNRISDVKVMLTNGPSAIVQVGGPNQTKTISACFVSDIRYDSQSIGVSVDASVGNISRVEVSHVACNTGVAGAAGTSVVSLSTAGAFSLNGTTVSSISSTASPNAVIRLRAGGTGTLEDTQISLVDGGGGVAGTFGIDIERASGVLRDVFIDGSVNVLERETPLRLVGVDSVGSNIKISPGVRPGTNSVGATTLSNIPNNTAIEVPLYARPFVSILMVGAGSNRTGQALARAATSPSVTPFASPAGMNFMTGVLGGTTGASGSLNVGVAEGALYFENRTGAALTVTFSLLHGY